LDVIDLGVGDPDFPTPPHILTAAHAALENGANHHYSSYRGLATLRRAFADWYQDRFGVVLDPDNEVLPLIGSKEGIGHVHLAFVEPGDEVLIPDPATPHTRGERSWRAERRATIPCVPKQGGFQTLASWNGETSHASS